VGAGRLPVLGILQDSSSMVFSVLYTSVQCTVQYIIGGAGLKSLIGVKFQLCKFGLM